MKTTLIVLAALLCGPSVAAEGTLHEDAAKLAELGRARSQAALDAVFGPGRSSVRVEVELGLTEKAQAWMDRALTPPRPPSAGGQAPSDYRYSMLSAEKPAEGRDFLLPGYPAEATARAAGPEGKGGGGAAEPAKPPVDAALLRAFGTDVVRVTAGVSLDAALPAEAEARARQIVADTLGISEGRGDTLAVSRESLPSVWRRILEDPALAAGMAARAALVAAAAVAFFGLWRFGRELRLGAERAAMRLAGGSGKNVEVTMGGTANLEGGGGGGAGVLPLGYHGPSGTVRVEEGEGKKVPEPDPHFDIDPEEAPKLLHLLRDQPAEHVALVVPHLKPSTRDALMEMMPVARSAAVLGSMVPVRFVDPKRLKLLRSELERRIGGVVGGVAQAAVVLRGMPSQRRGEVLGALRESDGEAAAALRGEVLLLEDIARLGDADLSLVIGETTVEELAAACMGGGGSFVAAVQRSLPTRSAQLVKELMELGGPEIAERAPRAREALLRRAESLIAEGRVTRPPAASARLGLETKP